MAVKNTARSLRNAYVILIRKTQRSISKLIILKGTLNTWVAKLWTSLFRATVKVAMNFGL